VLFEPDHKIFLEALCYTAKYSPDPSTQNTAVLYSPLNCEILAVTTATNGFPIGVRIDIESRWKRPEKYYRLNHAEAGAIIAAAKWGISTEGKWMYCPWASCGPCAAAIIDAGITRLITLESSRPTPKDSTHARWDESIAIAYDMFEEVGLEVTFIEGPVTKPGFTILRNGGDLHP
jgi:deoxycytidylate deaminase